MPAGKIILLNGASSSGKSSLAKVIQTRIEEPFWHFSIDHLIAANILPRTRIDSGEFTWKELRPSFFDGFHRCLPALVAAGNNLFVEHIVETEEWMQRLLRLLAGYDVFFIGVHCSLSELERRELARGDRRIGEARADHAVTHGFGAYDFEMDTSVASSEEIAPAVLQAWRNRRRPSAFERMAAGLR